MFSRKNKSASVPNFENITHSHVNRKRKVVTKIRNYLKNYSRTSAGNPLDLSDPFFSRYLKIYVSNISEYYNYVHSNNMINSYVSSVIIREFNRKYTSLYRLNNYIQTNLMQNINVFDYSRPVASGTFGSVHNTENIAVKRKIIEIDDKNIDYAKIFIEFFIQKILYTLSNDRYKNCIPKPYYIKKKNENEIIISFRNIANSISFSEYHNIIDLNITNQLRLSQNITSDHSIYITKLKNYLNILIKICDILNYYQNNFGFVHNDLHTSNILIDEHNNPYIIDFGFASIGFRLNRDLDLYLCSQIDFLPFNKINDNIKNVFNISKSTDLFQLICRITFILKKTKFKDNLIEAFYMFDNNQHNLYTTILKNKCLYNSINNLYEFATNPYSLMEEIKIYLKTIYIDVDGEYLKRVATEIYSRFTPINASRILRNIITKLDDGTISYF